MAAITLAIALLGAVLGVINTWNELNRNRERLKVQPSFFIHNQMTSIAIEVINHGETPVTVTGVGFDLATEGKHIPLVGEAVFLGDPMPWRIQPHASKYVVAIPAFIDSEEFRRVRRAYCKTAIGKRFTGTSEALQQVVTEGRPR